MFCNVQISGFVLRNFMGTAMITLPAHVTEEAGWDGESAHPQDSDRMVPNKETEMSWAEHQRIVCNARSLLISWTPDRNTGDAKKAFQAIYDAYLTTSGNVALKVSKGIHQPEGNAHVQIHVVRDFGGGNKGFYTFHLDVEAVEIVGVDELDKRFMWVGTQFKFENAKVWAVWPVLPAKPGGRPMKTPEGPSRRLSISSVDLAAHKLALENARKLKAADEARASTKGMIEAAVLKLAESGFKLRTLKNEPPKAFWAGTTKTYVINQYGKGHYVEWDAVKRELVKV